MIETSLISKPKYDSALYQVLHNRGIEDLVGYLNADMSCVSPPELLGEDLLKKAMDCLLHHITLGNKIVVIVDADDDGYCSAAILINYLYDLFPDYVKETLQWIIHDGKVHGISDCLDYLKRYDLVICPDSSSGEGELHAVLYQNGTDVICLDHHPVEEVSPYAIVINNQHSDYPNKAMSAAGVVWQFCRYLDKQLGNDYADNYLDLMSLGVMGDMMDIRNPETKALIFEGFKEKNIKNPFIYGMAEKNNFSLNKSNYRPSPNNDLMITPMGAAFFIIPLINAMTRSGTVEEQSTVFRSMLKFCAFELVPSTKRGHKLGEQEEVLTQALRLATNVKRRQTKAEETGIAKLEQHIQRDSMLDHQVLLFLLNKGEVNPNIAGLEANKIAQKYQRPTMILTKKKDGNYTGSIRGYTATGLKDFKKILLDSPGINWVAGHNNAAGASLDPSKLTEFQVYTDKILENALSPVPIYYVDYEWDARNIPEDKVLEIAEMNDYWGTGLERSRVLIKNIKITEDTLQVMKSNTLKFTYPNIYLIEFGAKDEDIENLRAGEVLIDAVCECTTNEWGGVVSPQLMIVDYHIIDKKQDILSNWSF